MQEAEVILRIAMHYIREKRTYEDVRVSIDGAHIKTKNTVHFDVNGFLQENGFSKCDGDKERWQGYYQMPGFAPRIAVNTKPGVGDVQMVCPDGKVLYIECKKFKSGNSPEYPAMREAIGQLMTGCPDDANIIPVVGVPWTEKSETLACQWRHDPKNRRVQQAGINFILVKENGEVCWNPEPADKHN